MQRHAPIEWQTIKPAASSEHLDPRALRSALTRDDRLRTFFDKAGQARAHVLLIVNDSHRSTPTRQVMGALSAVVSTLQKPPRVCVLVATGTHRFIAAERHRFEQETLAGSGLPMERVIWHDARDSTSLADWNGVRINEAVTTHRFLMPIGSIEPHYFAGTTGAHKTITIGCLSHDDIERNHAGAMSVHSEIMRLDGNPVFDGIISILDLFRNREIEILAVNTVVDQGQILGAMAGDCVETLQGLLPLVHDTFTSSTSAPVDLAHLKVPAPLGRSFYQADKALKNCHRVVRAGGGIILEASCTEGIGNDAFMDLLDRAPSYDEACRIIHDRGYRLGDHKAAKLLYLTDPRHRDVRVALVTRCVSDGRLAGVGVHTTSTVNDALDWLDQSTEGHLSRGVVVEDAGVMCVYPNCHSTNGA